MLIISTFAKISKAEFVGIKEFLELIRGALTLSEKNWQKLKESTYNWKEIFFFYVFPLAVVNSFAKILAVPDEPEFYVLSPNILFILYLLSTISSLFIGSYLIKLLAPRYLSQNNFDKIYMLVGISYTPIFVSNLIASLHSFLTIFSLIGIIYTILLFFKGVSIMLETPDTRRTGFVILCFLILFGVTIFVSSFYTYLIFYFTGNLDQIISNT